MRDAPAGTFQLSSHKTLLHSHREAILATLRDFSSLPSQRAFKTLKNAFLGLSIESFLFPVFLGFGLGLFSSAGFAFGFAVAFWGMAQGGIGDSVFQSPLVGGAGVIQPAWGEPSRPRLSLGKRERGRKQFLDRPLGPPFFASGVLHNLEATVKGFIGN